MSAGSRARRPGWAALFLLLVLLDTSLKLSASHFRGGIIMIRPQPGGTEYEMEIFYHISWRRSYGYDGGVHYCDNIKIAAGELQGASNDNKLRCQYGCPTSIITDMTYICTSFSIKTVEDWTFGERRLTHDFSFAAGNKVTIGFSGRDWIKPISSNWNISTTFSLATRNDTGRINSTPRAITLPVIRLQEGCNHTIALAVSDPDGVIVRCRWAVGLECAGICNDIQFPGAILNSTTCTIEYQANMGARYWAAAVMIEDFMPDSLTPLSSVGLQFLVLVFSSNSELCLKITFVDPTIRHNSCVAIPSETTFATQLIAESTSPNTSITEIQTAPPQGTRVGELSQIADSSCYYINVIWSPDNGQQNQTHMFCFTAVGSDRIASDQICINFLPGYYPPMLIPATAQPNQQMVHPFNTTWHVQFNTDIERSSVMAYISFHEYDSDENVYSIDASQSEVEVYFENHNQLSIIPNNIFKEKTKFYITLEREVVRGLEQCGPGNEPILDKNLWTFVTMDITPPVIRFIENATVSNTNVSFSWESNENATYVCVLLQGLVESIIDCSEAYWRGYGLNEGLYELMIRATDDTGNVATVTHSFYVDLTPPTILLLSKPSLVSSEHMSMFTFSCNESLCFYECSLMSSVLHRTFFQCNDGHFVTAMLQADSNYTFLVRAIDELGNLGESTSYTWQTDFEAPHIFGIQDTNTTCNATSPQYAGQAQAVDNRPEVVSLIYNDIQSGCSITRTWTAIDGAGNTAQVVQNINILFFPSVSHSPEVTLPCDSTSITFQASNNTAYIPNPCGLPVELTHEDSDYMCPGTIVRNWTVSVCGSKETASQTILLYDLCLPHACGRNESIPRGICSLGECQCNQPWYGEGCNNIIYEPVAEQINDTTIVEAQEYITTVVIFKGTPPLSWSLIVGPEQLSVDQYSGSILWTRAQAGNHTIVIQIENQVGRIQVKWTLYITPVYNASLLPLSAAIFPYAEPLLVQGYIEIIGNNVIEGNRASVLPVHVDIIVNGAIRTIATYTTANGRFSLTFYPSSTEYGIYTVGARHPSSTELLPQVEFVILGMKSVPSAITLRGEAIREFDKTFYNATVIYNDRPAPLSGLMATPVLPNTSDVSVEIVLQGSTPNSTLEPGDCVMVDIRVEASKVLSGLFLVHVEAREGTTLQIIANLHIDPALPNLSIVPPSLNARIVPGRSKLFEFNVTNSGRAVAHNVQSIIPETGFISFISFGNAKQREGSLLLLSGESALFSILIQAPSSQQLGEIDATIIIASNEVYTPLPMALIVTSDTLMNLTVVVEDEYTYFASGRPLVNNAAVTLLNYQRDTRLTQSSEAGDGTVKFTNIYEDRYELLVEAPSHRKLRQIIVASFETPVLTVFIERRTVTYTWSVTPITYQDVYSISIEAEFETRVPIPVVTVTPNEINLDELESGIITSIQLNITNHGLIRADNVGIHLPNHPFLKFTSITPVIGDIEPLSSVIVSVHSSRRSVQKRNTFNQLGNSFAGAVNWAIYLIDIVYSYVCNEPQIRKTPVVLKKPTICNNDQLRQPINGIIESDTSQSHGTVFYSAVISDSRNGQPAAVEFYPGRLGYRPINRGSFSFHGYSSKKVDFCNPCFSAILECTPTPFEEALDQLFPNLGCVYFQILSNIPVKTILGVTKSFSVTKSVGLLML